MSKKRLAVYLVIIAILIILIFLVNGFGLGGNGRSDGEVKKAQEEDLQAYREKVSKLAKTLKVIIREDKVYVGEQVFTMEEAFRDFLEGANNDQREVEIPQENALQGTSQWVIKVLDELKVTYTVIEQITEESTEAEK